MTAIAYRDGVLAADSFALAGQYIELRYTRKIVKRPDGSMAGASGRTVFCEQFLDCFLAGEESQFRPQVKNYDDFIGLVIYPEKGIFWAEEHGMFANPAPFVALGAADRFMLGAMAAGASAQQAVTLAIEHYGSVGGEIQILELG